MSNAIIELGTMESIKNYAKNGLANENLAGKTNVQFRLIREWSKNGSNKTKLGYIGVISNHGFTNANQLFEAWIKLDQRFQGLFHIVPATQASTDPITGVTTPAVAESVKLIINPAISYMVDADDKGNIIAIRTA